MALASLCRNSDSELIFTGFIVDHGVRHDSSDEAARVAESLHTIGIVPMILRLDWNTSGNPAELTNFEAVARKLRYRALGKACYDAGIRSLLVGHHADDQAETVLGRIVSGYLGTGLAGIQAEVGIPECAGLYGVDGSGWGGSGMDSERSPRETMAIERGDVRICRPLLPFTKDQLVEVCRERNVQWFEDPTNADRKLTIRNTIRHLHGQAVLPVALQRSRLCSLAHTVNMRTASIDAEVQRLFETVKLDLDLRLGKVTFTIHRDTMESRSGFTSEAAIYRIKSSLLRKLMQLITGRSIPLQNLEAAIDLVFSKSPRSEVVQVGKVNIQPATARDLEKGDGSNTFVLCRQKPNASDVRMATQLTVRGKDSDCTDPTMDWLLWDHRYWIRVRYDGQKKSKGLESMSVRFLTPDVLGDIRRTLSKQQRHVLDQCLAAAKEYDVLWTLPVVIAQVQGREHVVSLPSLRWDNPNPLHDEDLDNLCSEIRYMSVDLKSSNTRHSIIS